MNLIKENREDRKRSVDEIMEKMETSLRVGEALTMTNSAKKIRPLEYNLPVIFFRPGVLTATRTTSCVPPRGPSLNLSVTYRAPVLANDAPALRARIVMKTRSAMNLRALWIIKFDSNLIVSVQTR
ncbi:unnamed protein product [Leptidea sinapis]|uniref:Uncharacterized protein n=1 Tax=Leptidea sinapis TaxID=189913 RepID=A0A5E4Q1W9_9NEOP|nr:unnamed protein product [Leptidea sinapis]